MTFARYELPADVSQQIIETKHAAQQRLAEVQDQLQKQVDAVAGALCSIEAKRLKLSPGWRLSEDCKAIEVPQ